MGADFSSTKSFIAQAYVATIGKYAGVGVSVVMQTI
jgi:hypothetical protein